jgi:hypothetical protein
MKILLPVVFFAILATAADADPKPDVIYPGVTHQVFSATPTLHWMLL